MKSNMIRLILPMKGLNPNQKVILTDIILNEEDVFTATDCWRRLDMCRQTYNKQLRGLRKQGLIRDIKYGEYKLNVDIF